MVRSTRWKIYATTCMVVVMGTLSACGSNGQTVAQPAQTVDAAEASQPVETVQQVDAVNPAALAALERLEAVVVDAEGQNWEEADDAAVDAFLEDAEGALSDCMTVEGKEAFDGKLFARYNAAVIQLTNVRREIGTGSHANQVNLPGQCCGKGESAEGAASNAGCNDCDGNNECGSCGGDDCSCSKA